MLFCLMPVGNTCCHFTQLLSQSTYAEIEYYFVSFFVTINVAIILYLPECKNDPNLRQSPKRRCLPRENVFIQA